MMYVLCILCIVLCFGLFYLLIYVFYAWPVEIMPVAQILIYNFLSAQIFLLIEAAELKWSVVQPELFST